jgi:hypothetical protein
MVWKSAASSFWNPAFTDHAAETAALENAEPPPASAAAARFNAFDQIAQANNALETTMTRLLRNAFLPAGLACAAALAAQASAKDFGPQAPHGSGQPANKITCHRECDKFHVQYLVCYGHLSPAPTIKKTGLICI